jgi:hypothetical protein
VQNEATAIPAMKTVRGIAKAFHINKDRVRADCKAGKLKVAVRRMRGGRDGFWISVPSAALLYGVH